MSDRFIAAQPLPEADALLQRFVDLAHPRLGTEVTFATDDFFADKSRMIDPAPPVFYPDRFDDHGKWMDGWESRRKRVPGHDWAVIRLGRRGMVHAVDIDTSFFTGNFPPEAMVEAADTADEPGDGDWRPLVPRSPLQGNGHNLFRVEAPSPARWLRLHIHPDGGVARLRVFGTIQVDWSGMAADEEIDLAAQISGGVPLGWNDAHYGHPANMLAPGRAPVMADGWETARRRRPGNDWSVLKLGTAGTIRHLLIDTRHFKGNYPDRFSLRAARLEFDPAASELDEVSARWPVLVPETKLEADEERRIDHVEALGPVTHVRLDIFPDGGVSRLRLFGQRAP
ncbi:allantoicase [Aureimonas jatrophae]|uniref:Probable allantoicase n=1 Tax=Aureimonas jatrophae TaxID=1166073 RepID=A0A1H0HN08_9HYPH|nr:allantoicase [Aureimonas jatrophae]MBB3950680.1 allantoicase [Aureimonas jatrophae]SDO20586.1 allantoicase [Aureimonas jatrophae]